MARYDIENLMDDIKKVMTDSLNEKIASINTEKNDSIELASINDEAYFFQSMNESIANFDPFVFYGVVPSPDGNIGATAQELAINVIVIVQDNGDPSIVRRLFRYQRAVKELFEANNFIANNGTRLEIGTLPPVPLDLLNSSENHKAIGIELNTTLV